LLEALVARDAKRTGFAVALARSLARGGDARLAQGASEEAIALYERATELRKQLVQREPTSVPFRRTLAGSYAKLSRARELAGDVPRALEAANQALALRQLLFKDAAVEGGLKSELAASEIAVGRLTMARDPIAASASITSGAQRARELANNDPSNFEWKQTVIDGLLAQAAVAAVTKDRDGRASALADALVLANDAAHLATDNTTWPGYVAQVQVERAADAVHAGDAAGAAAARKAARDVLAPLAKDGRLSAQAVRLYDTVK
jgi:tetratricopeptide (TPR) repeat protein